MRRDFDIFEKFSDGSTLWKACVRGRFDALRKMHELAERSGNEFFMIDIQNSVLSSAPMNTPRSTTSTRAATAS
jgi:hypothetical protein